VETLKTQKGSDIARSLGLTYTGSEVTIIDACSAKSLKPNALTFAKNQKILGDVLKSTVRPVVVVTTNDSLQKQQLGKASGIGVILSERPRLSFIRAMSLLMEGYDKKPGKTFIHPLAVVAKDVRTGHSVDISAYAYVGSNTSIGNNVVIHPNVTIYGNTSIGDNVIIHSGTVIGKPGFGFEPDENGNWIAFPQIGRVVIEDNVEIGGNTVIDRGALEDTVIGSGTKIDNLVHVAHSVRIGKNCVLVACVQTGGSDVFGDNTWIGPNSSLIQGIRVGSNCLAGVGSVIVKDLPDNTKVAGNPAMPLDEFKKIRAAMKTLVTEKQ
jgi:UDP-3-O-[3-hydroxymyristoyl] glucosamine N-acyltransferase